MSTDMCKNSRPIGAECENKAIKDGLCNLCIARKELIEKMKGEGCADGMCEHKELNSRRIPEPLPVVYKGYCYFCLSSA